MEMCSRIGLEGRVPRFHDESAAEDDTREWQLVGTMSPRLINIQSATPRPVTTTRLRFVTIESLRFRGLLPPREGGDTRENSSHLEYRVACAKKWTTRSFHPPHVTRVRIFISANKIVGASYGNGYATTVVHRHARKDRFIDLREIYSPSFFSLSFFPLCEHNNTKRFAMIQWLNTRHETKARFLCPREQLSFSFLVICPRVAHLSNIGK